MPDRVDYVPANIPTAVTVMIASPSQQRRRRRPAAAVHKCISGRERGINISIQRCSGGRFLERPGRHSRGGDYIG